MGDTTKYFTAKTCVDFHQTKCHYKKRGLIKEVTKTQVLVAFLFRTGVLQKGTGMQKQNYFDRMELKKNNLLAAGLVSERFPGVSSIVLHMIYYQRATEPILMKRTLNFMPTDYACFRMDCMREECINGGFELTPVVAGVIKNHKKSAKGKIVCRGKNGTLRHNHASIGYEVSVQYGKPVK